VNILVWTDNDLDGAGASLVIKWLYSSKAKTFLINEVSESTISGKFKGILGTLDHYDKVFILDLDLQPEVIKVIDKENVVVIDHHATHVKNKHLYKNAKPIIEKYSSCTGLIYEKFKTALTLSDKQQQLINIIDQYDSYNINNVDSLKLNAIHRNLNNPKAEKFIDSFFNGFREYTVLEKNSIKLYFKKFKEQLQNGQVFKGKIKDYNIVATFADYAINEVAHFLIKKYNADIGIIVNSKAKTVSFRRSKESEVDVSVLAKTLCSGGGYPAAGGGSLTEQFANLTKTFLPC
jgi:oligoribonuclease NrnB/cAMP/cGMP phosphodiesterase (DHH superfamily)|tara:strand:- start:3912 stop:4784 length:873 start_codon:yes stop_codon:yes gene_type:complete